MDLNQLLSKIYDSVPEPLQEPAQALVETIGGATPYISSVMNYLKFRKINKELANHNDQILNVVQKLEASKNELYLKQEVFPIVLNRIINDEQPEKIKIMLNGFEYVIDNDVLDLDKIFHFYDVMAEMRLSEIFHLAEAYVAPRERMRNPEKITLKNIKLRLERTEEDIEREDLERYMNNKLFRLGILEYAKVLVPDQSSGRDYSDTTYRRRTYETEKYETNVDRYALSNFGSRFIEFFYEEETEESK